jgi:hypothetical protein
MSTASDRLCESGFHRWDRDLQIIRGETCVVRTCRCCGAQEVCWSPSGHHPQLKGPKSAKVVATN